MCAFCQIVSGRSEAEVVLEDDLSLAFLDLKPVFPGHTLLVPKSHHGTLSDLPAQEIHPFFAAAQTLARAVQEALQAEGTFVAVNNTVSQSVPHLHLHVVPRRKGDGLRGFFWPRNGYDGQEHLEQVAAAIRTVVARETGSGS